MTDEPTLFHFESGKRSFEDLGHANGATHWQECDVREALGYATSDSFRKAILRAKQACLSVGYQCEDHFVLQANGEHLITRFGCYLVAMNGDTKKPQVAAAQVYFATIAETFHDRLAHADGIDRMLIREEVTDGQKSLTSTAKEHGVKNYAFFQNKGYMGMYNMGLDRLCQLKGVEKGTLIDRMGKTELAAHLFRITQTDEKIKQDNVQGQQQLEQTAFNVGKKVRQTMQELSGHAPEDLPAAEHIKEVKKRLKETSKRMEAIDDKRKKEEEW